MRHTLAAYHRFSRHRPSHARHRASRSGAESGRLGTTAFTDRQVTLSFTSDIASVISPAPGFVTNPIGVASVAVAGSAAATFNAGAQPAFDLQAMGRVGIGANSRDPSVDQNGQTYTAEP